MLRGVIERHGLAREELGMVGDRLETDIGLGHRAGVFSVLVLSGASSEDDAAMSAEPPDLVVPSLKELGELLNKARCAE
jgi:ribonucleotide monophosphatase NagD (HAD superfamily)